jgi:hypothetical protein
MTTVDDVRTAGARPGRVAELVSSLLGSNAYPADDQPHRPGPWDPVIRSVISLARITGPQPEPWRHGGAVAEILRRFGPHPDPWRAGEPQGDAWRGLTSFGGFDPASLVALNPQPLPPRAGLVATLGQAALARAELIGEAAAHSGHAGAAGKYVTDLIDDWCGTPPRPFPWPPKGPRPNWARAELGALDHLVLASVMEQALEGGIGGDFAEGVRAAQQKLVETAMTSLRG